MPCGGLAAAAAVANGNRWETRRIQAFPRPYYRALVHGEWDVFFAAHRREQILNEKKKVEAAHAETDGASDSSRSSKSYSPVTMAVAAANDVIIALPWALL